MKKFHSLDQWLVYLESLHPAKIELGLDRISDVWKNCQTGGFQCPIITVAGTNGKGSTVSILESIFRCANYLTAAYTSPHLCHFNERICLNGEPASDKQIIDAFEIVESARGKIPLTYFEFSTLATLLIFLQARPDIIILEVGLGGRFDAINIIDANISIITSIDFDHMDYLGETLEEIGYEKAGVARAGCPLILASSQFPASVLQYATDITAALLQPGIDYDFEFSQEGELIWRYPAGKSASDITEYRLDLPANLKAPHQHQNLAASMMAVHVLQTSLPVSRQHLQSSLNQITLRGRQQFVSESPFVVLDVAHNPAAGRQLACFLQRHFRKKTGKCYFVFGMLKGRDPTVFLNEFKGIIDVVYFVNLLTDRAYSAYELETLSSTIPWLQQIRKGENVHQTLTTILTMCQHDDWIVVTGSFHAIAEAEHVLAKVA